MPLRIVSWNVNSIRARLGPMAAFIDRYQPDILCLQETKAADPVFPAEDFVNWGYPHQALSGAVGAPGVAILSRRPLSRVTARDWCGRSDHRHLEAQLSNGLELHNYYVPAGGDIPDPEQNPKYAHKLQFLGEMAAWYDTGETPSQGVPLKTALLVGDLNVAPLQTDVWSHKQLRNTITHTEVEIAALDRVRQAFGGVDVMRRLAAEGQSLFTWWSYRARDWQAANRGRRLDHVWATPAADARCIAMTIAQEVRGWEKPSDHAPVVVDMDLP
ncbi:MAG: exodeoxyribonuclease III [Rhodospirillales bacterium]|nr:exodeoxyribonuclease III [Rhodospirillales bacterium]